MVKGVDATVYGVGINDADYKVFEKIILEDGTSKSTTCPFYKRWNDMIKRCHDPLEQKRHPTYIGCSLVDEWLTFSNFKKWMKTQDWEGKHLDKDLIVKNNKLYSADTCVFINPLVNVFLTDSKRARGLLPLGVVERRGRYIACCNNPFKTSGKHIGTFDTPEEAHEAWRSAKHKYACQLADSDYVTDPRVADSLRKRYLN